MENSELNVEQIVCDYLESGEFYDKFDMSKPIENIVDDILEDIKMNSDEIEDESEFNEHINEFNDEIRTQLYMINEQDHYDTDFSYLYDAIEDLIERSFNNLEVIGEEARISLMNDVIDNFEVVI